MTLSIVETEDTRDSSVDKQCLEAPKYSCALGGALAVVTNIHRAIPIIHAGAGCGSNQLLSFRTGGGNQGVGYISGMITPSTNLAESEVVFGGEQKLREQIRATLELIDGDFFVVAGGCISGMIGDDIGAVVKEFADEPTPVIHTNASGFLGNTFTGYDNFFEAVTDQLLESRETEKGLVNILGFVPFQDIFWRGNLRILKELLAKLDLKTNQVVGDFSGLEGLKKLSAAELTLVISPWAGMEAAQHLESKFGVPYLAYPNLPVGPQETSAFLRAIGEKLNLSKSKIENLIQEEEKEAYKDLDLAGDACATFGAALPFAIVAGSATAVGITRFLTNEVGFTPTLVVINDNPPEGVRQDILKRLQNLTSGIDPKVVFEVDTYYIRKHLKQADYRVLLGSSQERFLAQEERKLYVSITYPAHDRLVIRDTYAGYGGGIAVLEDILSKFIMPY